MTPNSAPTKLASSNANKSKLETHISPSELGLIEVTTIATGLDFPWAVAALPDGRFLVTERPGAMRLIASDGTIGAPLKGVPKVFAEGQGGMLDVILDPDFKTNQTIYFSFAEPQGNTAHTAIARARLGADAITDVIVLFRQTPDDDAGFHFGSRLVIDQQGHLYATMGERNTHRELAQDLNNTVGKVIRIHRDGSIPTDNPLLKNRSAQAVIWSYGHRNPQGAALHPVTGEVWVHEHGPRGGDEINVVRAGKNYGWPVISYGTEYSGLTISKNPRRDGMEDPLYFWVPSIAPSGMAIMHTPQAGAWNGNVFVGALKAMLLARLELKDGKIAHEERLLSELKERIRDVRALQDGSLLVLTETKGQLLRVKLKWR